MAQIFLLWTVFASCVFARTSLEQAYTALQQKDYDAAIRLFRETLAETPANAAVHKDLAYALLRVGENEAARDEFAEAMRLAPSDDHAALEFAFLAHETKQPLQARRVFDRLRRSGNEAAEEYFQRIDRPLADGIARWRAAVAEVPDAYSAHEELARLAELRDDPALAAPHYFQAWRLRPDRRSLLLDYGRVLQQAGDQAQALSALLAVSRGGEPHAAERALELLPSRYPYVYEFHRALALDPKNPELRRELAYLHLAMGHAQDAEVQFAAVVQLTPDDLLSNAQLGFLRLSRGDTAGASPLLELVLKGDDEELADRVRSALRMPKVMRRRPETPRAQVKQEAKALAKLSFDKGYMKDALKYLAIAHENDPLDFEVMLKLGWTNNILKNDPEAVRWFELVRRGPDAAMAAEADHAYRSLSEAHSPVHITLWMQPIFSSRWGDVFAYGQLKAEINLPRSPIRPYFTGRLLGDIRGIEKSRALSGGGPQYLSENAVILGVGIATRVKHGVFAWAEAGTAFGYRANGSAARLSPDYRGGISLARTVGTPLGSERGGWFLESINDGVFVSRFDNNFLLVSQNKIGRTIHGGLQLFWSANYNADVQRQYWANFLETGPGLRLRWASLPAPVHFTFQALRGVYLVNQGNPRRPNFFDFRAGFWYAITR